MIAIIDYGAGNIFSVKNALDYLGLPGELTADPEKIRKADALILPGVGAFPSAMQMLHDSGLTDVIREESHKKPFLGICLGMQLIFEKGYEFEECDGLGLVPGKVEKIEAPGMVIPHMGWNKLEMQNARQKSRQWYMTAKPSTAHSSTRKRAAKSGCKSCETLEG